MKINQKISERVSEFFGALSDPSRVRIIAVLIDNELNISSIVKAIGLSQSAVSHQMRGLKQLRLVRTRREGRRIYYSLEDQHVAELFRQGVDHVRHSHR